jgi:hypothetical protein
MQITYEIEVDLGEDYDEGTPSPTATDIETAVVQGLNANGFTVAGVTAEQQ